MESTEDRGRMVFGLGAVVTAGGTAGYLAGILAPYPGRAFSVTALMVGVTLLAVGNAMRGRVEA